MARRLLPEERRAEIIERTRQLIAEEGPEDLSMRRVARWCGMSAPGLIHHFESLEVLMTAVLKARRDDELAKYAERIDQLGSEATLRDLTDATVEVAARTPRETQNFDRLEVIARADPTHPAHSYFDGLDIVPQVRPMSLVLAEREYKEPLQVVKILSVVAEGFRARWSRSKTVPDYMGDWLEVADSIFAGLDYLKKEPETGGDP